MILRREGNVGRRLRIFEVNKENTLVGMLLPGFPGHRAAVRQVRVRTFFSSRQMQRAAFTGGLHDDIVDMEADGVHRKYFKLCLETKVATSLKPSVKHRSKRVNRIRGIKILLSASACSCPSN